MGVTPSTRMAFWSLEASESTRSGFEAISVAPYLCSMVTGKAAVDAGVLPPVAVPVARYRAGRGGRRRRILAAVAAGGEEHASKGG